MSDQTISVSNQETGFTSVRFGNYSKPVDPNSTVSQVRASLSRYFSDVKDAQAVQVGDELYFHRKIGTNG